MKNTCSQCKTNMREKWIKLHLEQNISIPELTKLAGYHENTLYNWKSNYLKYGITGLIDKSKAAHYHPNEYSEDTKEKIKLLRLEAQVKEKRYLCPKIIALRLKKRYNLEASPSGIGKFLNKSGLIPEERKRRITKDMFNKKLKEYKEKQAELEAKMESYTDADENYYLTANMVLNLAKKAYEIFQVSEVSEKRQLLSFLLQNLRLQGKNLIFELKTPFNTVLQASKCSDLLRGLDSNQQPSA